MEKKKEKKNPMEEIQAELQQVYTTFNEVMDALKKIQRLEEELSELGIDFVETWYDYKREEPVARLLPDYFSVGKMEEIERKLGLKNTDLIAIRGYKCIMEPFILPRKIMEFMKRVHDRLHKEVCIRNETTPEKARYYIDIVLKRYELIYVILRLVYEEEDREENQ